MSPRSSPIGWKDENRARTVAMSMAKNTAQFHRLPNGLFGLVEFYPDVIERKQCEHGLRECVLSPIRPASYASVRAQPTLTNRRGGRLLFTKKDPG
jgi:hypothetical protein